MVFYLVATETFACEISRRDNKASSCNHDMDLVIDKVFVGLMSSFGINIKDWGIKAMF